MAFQGELVSDSMPESRVLNNGERVLSITRADVVIWDPIAGAELSRRPRVLPELGRIVPHEEGLIELSFEMEADESLEEAFIQEHPKTPERISISIPKETSLVEAIKMVREKTGLALPLNSCVDPMADLSDAVIEYDSRVLNVLHRVAESADVDVRFVGFEPTVFGRLRRKNDAYSAAIVRLQDLETGRTIFRSYIPHLIRADFDQMRGDYDVPQYCALTPDKSTAVFVARGIITVQSTHFKGTRSHVLPCDDKGAIDPVLVGLSDDGIRALIRHKSWAVVDTVTGDTIAQGPIGEFREWNNLTLSPSGRFVLEATDAPVTRLWDVEKQSAAWEFPAYAHSSRFIEDQGVVLIHDRQMNGDDHYALPLRAFETREIRRAHIEQSHDPFHYSQDGERVIFLSGHSGVLYIHSLSSDQLLVDDTNPLDVFAPLKWKIFQWTGYLPESPDRPQHISGTNHFSTNSEGSVVVVWGSDGSKPPQLHAMRRLRPEQYWGVAWMPEAWLLALTILMLVADGIEVWLWRRVLVLRAKC